MITAKDIRELSLPEKLQVMEAIWDDIARQEDELEMPQWQKDLLDERERLVASGEAKFIDWEEARKQISDAIQ